MARTKVEDLSVYDELETGSQERVKGGFSPFWTFAHMAAEMNAANRQTNRNVKMYYNNRTRKYELNWKQTYQSNLRERIRRNPYLNPSYKPSSILEYGSSALFPAPITIS